ncbi:C4-dicarboxylate ABC transporter permease [Marinobacterium iners]|jgi:TRAP transporter 4TM/12TM fusion protein|uniref:TRAP transporter, 4TM/12TM fusion protein n=1 Tax=Marinobacterium iners DSM 11526 TaxID=1122198 RepID=A0A1H4DWY1_9GAMM|nr:TRAP transporter fused permease subunit [Marinobacterium iners]QSR33549.1 C4-dicarboxylate ABC transporter permease [Marinobacterium iners]SEA76712.1 TRAP transporter, 4TM/12TM fusion protein [Marinobacterium iners DSM 11526]
MTDKTPASADAAADKIGAEGVADVPLGHNERDLSGAVGKIIFFTCVCYTLLHLYALNVSPIETWAFRIIHVAGGLVVGFALIAAFTLDRQTQPAPLSPLQWAARVPTSLAIVLAAAGIAYAWFSRMVLGELPPNWLLPQVAWALALGTGAAVISSWIWRTGHNRHIFWADRVLMLSAIVVAAYLLFVLGRWRMAAGTPMAGQTEFLVALAGVVLIMELTRRVAGLALIIITAVFLAYAFAGPWLPGILEHRGYSMQRFFTYIYTDNGILGPTTAVSSTYIILFITFAAFLQASRVGDYFVNFAFAAAGRARGGPAKVAVFASGLMGMINGTSAGNVVATGSLTIPLMKKVGYHPRSAGGIEAAASTGGQIVPPIMGAGAFIMAEVTGIPYTDIAIAALIPAALYFLSIYFMVDLEARREGMSGLSKDQLPVFSQMIKQVYLFLPIIILVSTLFMGYSVIRAGTLAMVSAAVVSWLTPYRMGIRALLEALSLGARMAIPLIAVCACAGIIVGVISLTGVGARFASMLLGIADASHMLALFFAMCISILLGMGMPTTAAYAVAASVVAPGLQQIGIPPLVAHFFVFYYAVLSAITPPVALAGYAAAAISGTDPLKTAVTSFKFGLAAFIVPFMFFYSPALLMQGGWGEVLRVFITASAGIYLLAASIQGWFLNGSVNRVQRCMLLVAALAMIAGGLLTDAIGIGLSALVLFWQLATRRTALAS